MTPMQHTAGKLNPRSDSVTLPILFHFEPLAVLYNPPPPTHTHLLYTLNLCGHWFLIPYYQDVSLKAPTKLLKYEQVHLK